MKMTPHLGRTVSVWLCVALVYWFLQFSVGCTESLQEGVTILSSQNINSEDNTGENSNHLKNDEENSIPPAQLSSESEQVMEGNHHSEDQIPVEQVGKQHAKAFEVDSVAEKKQEAEQKVLVMEETSINQQPEAVSIQDQDAASVNFTPNLQDHTSVNPEEDMNNSESAAAVPEPAASEDTVSDQRPENPYESESSSPPLVLENNANAHTPGTKSHSDPLMSPPAAHSTEHPEAHASDMQEEPDMGPLVTTDTDLSSKGAEDNPTFDEWRRKMMEVEKEQMSTRTSNKGGLNGMKKAQKNFNNNYASVECGAKILGANPEAKSTSAILKENMDLYMLNPCGNKIWFIIELCEPIQLKQLDIANFELFSSTPKDFLVSISDRYPTNKWLKLGAFHARDERTVQSFPLDEHIYAKYVKMFSKYIKVELVSHFGSEHFCPLSLIRVFGTSMVEEYDESGDPSERHEDSDDDLDGSSGSAQGDAKLSENLIGSAKDAILSMVNNIAVNVLGGTAETQENLGSEPSPDLQNTAETTTEELTVTPDQKDVKSSSDTVTPTEVVTKETSATLSSAETLTPTEEVTVFPLKEDEEEPISSSITLLDKEVDLEEESETNNQNERVQEKQIHPSAVTSLPSSSCSFATFLHEYLQQKCSALRPEKRKCQAVSETLTITPTQTVPSYLPLTISEYSNFPQRHSDSHDRKQPEPSGDTVAPKTPEIPVESMFESVLLEPSQTVTLLPTSATDSTSGQHIDYLETPSLSLEEPDKDGESIKNQKTLNKEERSEPSASLPSSVHVTLSARVPVEGGSPQPKDKKPIIDGANVETSTVGQTLETTDQPQDPQVATVSPNLDLPVDSEGVLKGDSSSMEASHHLSPEQVTEVEPPDLHLTITDAKKEELAEDLATSSDGNSSPPSQTSSTTASPSPSDIYAQAPNDTEQNGNQVHSSSQKESVFMRLNNRIKALEMNMSLSGRYLEQLSQRYRKQMEEMQKAFNKTMIKLQNTSKIAEEQDQRQTESIQLLQGQLENMTQHVLNLSVRVSQLQSEVLDRQNYLLLSLLLCLVCGLLLCAYNCWISTNPPITESEPPIPNNYTVCCPEREFSCDELTLKKSASYPLIHSESLQLATTEGLEKLHSEETLSVCLTNRKKKRRKMKSVVNTETLHPSLDSVGQLCNGAVVCNGASVTTDPPPHTERLLHPSFRDSPSEGSSEASSHSDDPSFCGITTACSGFCDGLPVARIRAEKRALRRRRPKGSCAAVHLLQAS
ncbi:SUN domain-containing ossification factor isoform X2 [Gouania willdenowi]|uniref:SUN domain-containing ossification factor isoform X2 n=1 Tax=Gouania willdenowi TaxID=441366 RepID=UPI001055B264|nr:SUN domain-containing ossification factor-like isoform X2 [Gouania willdenowi]